MIDLATEKLINLAEAAHLLPHGRGDRPTHVSTILRWVLRGFKGVRLEAVRCGVRWVTSEEALARFVARLTPDLESIPEPPRSPAARSKASERAGKQLERIGA